MTRLIIGVTGASGAIYGTRLLEVLKRANVETHLVITKNAEMTIQLETEVPLERVRSLATKTYDINDLTAAIASGSFKTDGMVILPCSMKTLSGIANGFSENLLLRAADVVIKEKRYLILSPREAPLSVIHLENMLKLARMGVIVLPPMPAFYTKPKTIDEIVDQTLGKILDLLNIEHQLYRRWLGSQ